MSPTLQDLSNDTTFSKIKSRVPVPLTEGKPSVIGPNKQGRWSFVGPDFAANVKKTKKKDIIIGQ